MCVKIGTRENCGCPDGFRLSQRDTLEKTEGTLCRVGLSGRPKENLPLQALAPPCDTYPNCGTPLFDRQGPPRNQTCFSSWTIVYLSEPVTASGGKGGATWRAKIGFGGPWPARRVIETLCPKYCKQATRAQNCGKAEQTHTLFDHHNTCGRAPAWLLLQHLKSRTYATCLMGIQPFSLLTLDIPLSDVPQSLGFTRTTSVLKSCDFPARAAAERSAYYVCA